MIVRLEIDAFKAFDHQAVELDPFSVLVGRNGSGKTSVLQALEFFHGVVAGNLPEHLERHGWNYKDLPRLKATNFEFGFTALLDLGGSLFWWKLRLGKRLRPGIAGEVVYEIHRSHAEDVLAGTEPDKDVDELLLDRTGRTMHRYDWVAEDWESITQTLTSSWLQAVDTRYDRDRFPGLVAVAEWARHIQPYVVLDPNRLREPSRLSSRGIGAAGEQLAGFLRHLRTRRPEAFARVWSRVKSAYPRLDEIEIQTTNGAAFSFAVRESWSTEANPLLNARQASDGLLRLFAFAALPEVTPKPTLIMVDELENGVHPELLGAVVTLLETLADEEDIQVVSTSHSPVVLNYVSSAGTVVLTMRDADGRATIRKLDETAGYERLASAFEPGEMWLALGERGLIDGPDARGA